ncbi:MAG: FAD-binding oxidoreductase, partial [Candidatus Competibacteraceae bacterium]|nr:FAD-binding oxidoreductase [Candidatus Competibacteraceae bacterium]
LYGIPEAISAAVCSFPSVEAAVNTVILTIQSGIPIARIELADGAQMAAFNLHSKLDYPEQPHLFLEFQGSANSVQEQIQSVQDIASEFGGGNFQWATRQEDRNKLWEARHNAAYACMALCPGRRIWATDVCVPISKLAECIVETQRDLEQSPLTAPIVGHVGDGNFHVSIMVDPNDESEIEEASRINDRLVARALALDGTCTGEHGIGYGKIEFLNHELGEAVSVMRTVKQALDPDNIMNPGKVLRV